MLTKDVNDLYHAVVKRIVRLITSNLYVIMGIHV